MGFSTSTCTEFVEVLSSKAPVPGGGGASALVAAVGTALGNMVGSLTVGKKKYADVEADIIFLGPQVRYAKEEIQKTVGSIPVYMIGMKDYGMMNGDSVLAQALEYLGK